MKYLFVIYCFCCTGALNAQTPGNTTLVPASKTATGTISNFTVDNLGNLYVLTPSGLLKKLNSRGDSLNVFNEVRRYGTVYQMDVTNPLKVLLYYKDFSTVVMLDRFLNRVNTIDFRKAGIFQSKAVGLSYDNNVWIYDEQSARLKKISDDGKLLNETVDLRQVLSVLPSPEKIIDRDGFVYLYDPAKGLYVFDYYGALKNELPVTQLTDLQVIGKTIAGRRGNLFVKYTLGSLDLQESMLPGSIQAAEKICIMPQGIYVMREDSIELYSFEQLNK
ncbi:MAG: hypothetical protein KF862_27935 [Chitinophagaceae bacterium]|nr:hypothetical protein [Chitinophagaceae bacterium]